MPFSCPTAWAGGSSAANSPPHRRPAPRWSSAAAPVCRRDVPVPFRTSRTGRRCPPAASDSPAFPAPTAGASAGIDAFPASTPPPPRPAAAPAYPPARCGHTAAVPCSSARWSWDQSQRADTSSGYCSCCTAGRKARTFPHGQSVSRILLRLSPPSFRGHGIGTPSQTPPWLTAHGSASSRQGSISLRSPRQCLRMQESIHQHPPVLAVIPPIWAEE